MQESCSSGSVRGSAGQPASLPGYNIDWDLMMRAVRHHTQDNWVLLYIERWLRAEGTGALCRGSAARRKVEL